MDRRYLLKAGGVGALLGNTKVFGADNRPEQDRDARPSVIRIFTTEDDSMIL